MAKPKVVPAVVKSAIKQTLFAKRKAPHLSELAQHFTDLVGGPRAVAKMLQTEFFAAPSGGIVRSRILEIIFRATKMQNDKDGTTDIVSLSDDELEQQLSQLLEETGAPENHP